MSLLQQLPTSSNLHDTRNEEEASPLGDYLADAQSSFDLGAPFNPDATIRRRRKAVVTSPRVMTEGDNLAGETPEAGPSRMRISRRSSVRREDDAFAERFKYLIASSGLLEKTQLDLSSSKRSDRTESEAAASPIRSGLNIEPVKVSRPGSVASSYAGSLDGVVGVASRWDIMAALTVIVISLAYVLGPTAIIPSTALATGVALLQPKRHTESAPHTPLSPPASFPPSPAVRTIEIDDGTTTSRVLTSLETLLTESRLFDQTVTSSLQTLAPRPDDTGHAHELRIALHRLLDDMTDSLATCTSTLIPMADRSELAVLEKMYDIPVLGPRRQRNGSEDFTPDRNLLRPRASSFGGPDNCRTLTSSPFDPNDKFTKLPDRLSRRKGSNFSVDLTGSPVPFRPALQSRISESADEDADHDALCPDSGSAITSSPDNSPMSPSRKAQTFVPKITSPLAQALERLEGGGFTTPSFSGPKSPPAHQRSSYRRSLQDIRYINSTPSSSSEAATNLALARASANLSTANRRSLQAPQSPHAAVALEQAIASAGANLHRARSLPQGGRGLKPLVSTSTPGRVTSSAASERSSPTGASVRSDLRSIHSTPSSRRASFMSDSYRDVASLGIGLAPSHTPRILRIGSVSPLTLGGLKSSYFGVHQKRRRVMCCLLGMRFSTSQEDDYDAYWGGVSEALVIVCTTMTAGRQELDRLCLEVERQAAAVKTLSIVSHGPPTTPPRQSLLGDALITQPPSDFAPRDSTEQALLTNVDELQRTLARVWARCDEMRAQVASGEAEMLETAWTEVRSDIGGLLRHVERGRELARREGSQDESVMDEEGESESSGPLPVPDFIRAWVNPSPGPVELERQVDELPDETLDDDLPAPGIDKVYEAIIPAAAPRPKTSLSREERIALSKEARARGVTLAQLTAASNPEQQEKEEQRRLEVERMRAESEMISELEGMFGAIRRRKGMEA